MKRFLLILTLLAGGLAGLGQSPLPPAQTRSVVTTPDGILTGTSTTLFSLNTNLLWTAAAPPVNGASNALVGAINTASNSLAGNVNSSSNTLASSIASLTSSTTSAISSAVSTATSAITSAYNAAISAAQYQIDLLIATRSVNSIADLLATRTDSLPGATNGLTVMVRGYYGVEGDGGGMFHLVPVSSLPADITGTNRGTCFATSNDANMRWVRRDRSNLSVKDFGARCSASIDDHTIVQDAINAAKEITFPAGTTTKLGSGTGSAIAVPTGRHLRIAGTLVGPDNLQINGSALIDGGGTINLSGGYNPAVIDCFGDGGDITVRDLRILNSGSEFGVRIEATALINALSVERVVFEGSYYGVLREATVSNVADPTMRVGRARVINCVFTNIYSTAIDFEPMLADGSREACDNRISNVHYLFNGLNGFGGGGISMAGWNYDGTGDETNQLHQVTVSRNTIDRCRFPIHLEVFTDFTVADNVMTEVLESMCGVTTNTLTFPDAGTTGIAIWACKRGTVTGNRISRLVGTYPFSIAIGGAYDGGGLASVSDRIVVSGNSAEGGELGLSSIPRLPSSGWPNGVVPTVITAANNDIRDGFLSWNGSGQLNLIGNTVRAPWGKSAFNLTFNGYFNSRFQNATRNLMVIRGNIGVNPIGAPSVSLTGFSGADVAGNIILIADGNNFAITTKTQQANPGGSVYYSTNGVPYGFTFKAGDVVMDISQRPPVPIVITSDGSRTVPGDYCNAQVATNVTKGWISSAALPWTSGGYHQVGQLVQVTGTPGTVTAMIGDIFYDSTTSTTVARLISPTTGLPLDLTGFTPSVMQAANEVGYSVGGVASVAWDPPSISAGAATQLTALSVTGARPGDLVSASFSLDTQGIILFGVVTANDLVRITAFNPTGGSIDLASGTLRVSTSTR